MHYDHPCMSFHVYLFIDIYLYVYKHMSVNKCLYVYTFHVYTGVDLLGHIVTLMFNILKNYSNNNQQ